MKTKERIIGAAWTLARIVSALAIGWLAFSRFTMTMFIDTNFAASAVGSLCFGAIAFYMLKVRHWRFWAAVVIGAVLWYATMGICQKHIRSKDSPRQLFIIGLSYEISQKFSSFPLRSLKNLKWKRTKLSMSWYIAPFFTVPMTGFLRMNPHSSSSRR